MKQLLLVLTLLFFSHAGAAMDKEVCIVPVNQIEHSSIDGDESFTLLTNPVRDGSLKIRLDSIKSASVRVTIINSLGNEVFTATHNTVKSTIGFDVSKLASGIYFLRVQTDESNLVKKLIIQ